jgi:CRISPR-associated exonuclease Cas4
MDIKVQDSDPIMISALEHYSYCPRQCLLIRVNRCVTSI